MNTSTLCRIAQLRIDLSSCQPAGGFASDTCQSGFILPQSLCDELINSLPNCRTAQLRIDLSSCQPAGGFASHTCQSGFILPQSLCDELINSFAKLQNCPIAQLTYQAVQFPENFRRRDAMVHKHLDSSCHKAYAMNLSTLCQIAELPNCQLILSGINPRKRTAFFCTPATHLRALPAMIHVVFTTLFSTYFADLGTRSAKHCCVFTTKAHQTR